MTIIVCDCLTGEVAHIPHCPHPTSGIGRFRATNGAAKGGSFLIFENN